MRLRPIASLVALGALGLGCAAFGLRAPPPLRAQTFGARVAFASAFADATVHAAPVEVGEPEPVEAPPRASPEAATGPVASGRLTLTPLAHEPKEGEKAPSDKELAGLRAAVEATPKDRAARFKLVRALMRAAKLEDALTEARAWRERDAYNLVVVRLQGDILSELGRRAEARRAYSAVVELLPRDTEAQRALATVLKQSGDLDGAYDRLRAATATTNDVRTSFELADVAHRLGRNDEAATRFASILMTDGVREAVRYPAKQRLAQIRAAERRDAIAHGDAERAKGLAREIDELAVKGGVENDVKVYLTWDTDRSDIDLHVLTPSGEEVDYRHRSGRGGEALFDDVTTGYGPESFTAHHAQTGRYVVKVDYYGTSRQTFTEARGEVTVILHEGTDLEKKTVLPYRLFSPKQNVEVAAIDVRANGGAK